MQNYSSSSAIILYVLFVTQQGKHCYFNIISWNLINGDIDFISEADTTVHALQSISLRLNHQGLLSLSAQDKHIIINNKLFNKIKRVW